MTLLTLPSSFRPASFSMQLETVQRAFASPFGGSEQVVDLLNDRWTISLTLPVGTQQNAARNEAFLNALRGQTNTVSLYHWARRQPLGTMRGSPVAGAASVGADSILIGTPAGSTLLAGDMIGVSGMLLMVRDDCVADGVGLVVPLVNRLRRPLVGGESVTWDRPTVPFRKVVKASFQYFPGYAEGVSLDFVEAVG
ncbi:hypothetical protein J2W35_003306 [Variovorax boronicumulans]|uniref:hypothetical protein n=1 Tax=Variovorax boronicumulans TaxID=436515 RepID=UPI00278ABD32|nr:hypothetical protein [Variovorax boronicumulans]MDQ0082947.1 hypothetical protein [Variovorax boronicumulans]